MAFDPLRAALPKKPNGPDPYADTLGIVAKAILLARIGKTPLWLDGELDQALDALFAYCLKNGLYLRTQTRSDSIVPP